jgi:flagellar biosynthesis protein FlhG
MRILPIASGKGGVGKSLLAANLAIVLGEAGKSVILADLDLGASNVHQILGLKKSDEGIGTYLTRSNSTLADMVQETDYLNLRVLPGDTEIPGLANLQSHQKKKLIRGLAALETDYLILDLGAGTSFNTIDFFLMTKHGIVITSPTLTSTLNAYLFLKNVIFRLITDSFTRKSPAMARLEEMKKDGASLQRVYIPQLIRELGTLDPEGHQVLIRHLTSFRPLFVLNMLDNPRDVEKGDKIKRSCQEYLGIEIEHLGVIYRDHMQDVALRSRLPITRYKPESVISQAIYRMADKIIQTTGDDRDVLEIPGMDESFQVAELEAEVDFSAKVEELQRLLHTGALTQGDLLETIKSQQFEISSLKKENQLLKTKLLKALEPEDRR